MAAVMRGTEFKKNLTEEHHLNVRAVKVYSLLEFRKHTSPKPPDSNLSTEFKTDEMKKGIAQSSNCEKRVRTEMLIG